MPSGRISSQPQPPPPSSSRGRHRSWLAAPLVLTAMACVALATALPLSADDPGKSSYGGFVTGFADKDAKTAKFQYNGCIDCHDSKIEGDEPGSADETSKFHMGFRQYTTWRNEDRHSRAHRVVVEGKGKLITERLGYNEKEITERCLTCHAPLALEAESRFASPKATGKQEMRSQSNLVKRGVGCEVCHGPASGRGGWLGPHDDIAWREKSPESKLATGMLDMRHPVTLAERCTTCHIGRADKDPAKSWVVSHDMYVAGHPPLPAIELATYAESEPNHWRWLKDKGDPKDPKVTDDILGALAKSLGIPNEKRQDWVRYEKSMITVVGAAVNLREAMLLVANQAASGDIWPELAQLDCYVCHHELERDSWRQEPGHYEGAPGRVPYPHWQTTLAELSIEAVGNPQERQTLAAEFQRARWEFRQAFLIQPFGDSPAIQAKASALADWANKLTQRFEARIVEDDAKNEDEEADADADADADAKDDEKKKAEAKPKPTKRVDGKTLDDEAAKRILNRICAIFDENRQCDFDTARQLAWAFKIVYGELGAKPATDAQIREILAQSLDRALVLTILPMDQAEKLETATKAGGAPGWDAEESPYTLEANQRVKALSAYDPQAVKACFAKLRRLLGE